MAQLNIAEAKAHFSKIVRRAARGEEIVIAKDNHPLVRLVPVQGNEGDRVPGSAKHHIVSVSPDFAGTPEDFKDYM